MGFSTVEDCLAVFSEADMCTLLFLFICFCYEVKPYQCAPKDICRKCYGNTDIKSQIPKTTHMLIQIQKVVNLYKERLYNSENE